MVQADPVFRSRPATCPRAVVIRESSVHLSKPFFQSRNLCNQGGESFKIVATVQPPQYLQAKTLQKWNFETQRLPRPSHPPHRSSAPRVTLPLRFQWDVGCCKCMEVLPQIEFSLPWSFAVWWPFQNNHPTYSLDFRAIPSIHPTHLRPNSSPSEIAQSSSVKGASHRQSANVPRWAGSGRR